MKNDKKNQEKFAEPRKNIAENLQAAQSDINKVHEEEEVKRHDISTRLNCLLNDMNHSSDLISQEISKEHDSNMQRIEALKLQLMKATNQQYHPKIIKLIEQLSKLDTSSTS